MLQMTWLVQSASGKRFTLYSVVLYSVVLLLYNHPLWCNFLQPNGYFGHLVCK